MPFDWQSLMAMLGGGQTSPGGPITGSQAGGPMGGQMQPTPQMAPGSTGIPIAAPGGGGLMGGGYMGPLAAAAGMLNASGPSRMPVGLGQVMGQGLTGMLQGGQLDQQQALQQQQQESLQRIGQQLSQPITGGGRPPVMMPPMVGSSGAGAPGAIPLGPPQPTGPVAMPSPGGGGPVAMPSPGGGGTGRIPFFPSQQQPNVPQSTALASMPGLAQMPSMRQQANPFIALMRQRGMMV